MLCGRAVGDEFAHVLAKAGADVEEVLARLEAVQDFRVGGLGFEVEAEEAELADTRVGEDGVTFIAL